jgi:hypothetical protein
MKRLIALLTLLPLLGMGGGQYTIPWHTGATAAAAAIPTPLNWWKLNGTVTDEEGANNGTWAGSAGCSGTYYQAGVNQTYDGCFVSVNSNYISTANATGYSTGSGAWTVTMWVYESSMEPVFEMLFGYGTFSDHGNVQTAIGNGSGSNNHICFIPGSGNNYCGTTNVSIGAWHFVAVTYAAGATSITTDVDGTTQSVSIVSALNVTTAGTYPPVIGNLTSSYYDFYNGAMADVRYYTSALTITQLNAIQAQNYY